VIALNALLECFCRMPTGLKTEAGIGNVSSAMAVQLSVEDLIEYTDWEPRQMARVYGGARQ
jgi:hypothetical protein